MRGAVALATTLDRLHRLPEIVPAENLRLLRLELFVCREERFDLPQPVPAEIFQRPHVSEARVAHRNGKHLEIRPLFVVQPSMKL